MSRLATAAQETEAQALANRFAWLLRLDLPSGVFLTTTADKALTYDSETYNPNGALIQIGDVTERSDNKPAALGLTMAATDDTLRAAILNDEYHDSEVKLHLAFLNANHDIVSSTVAATFVYDMDSATIQLAQNGSVIQINCDSYMARLGRRNGVIASPSEQKERHTGDTYCDWVHAVENVEFEWGGYEMKTSGPTHGGRGAGMPYGSFGGRPREGFDFYASTPAGQLIT